MGNAPALLSVVLGLLAVAALPAAIVALDRREDVELIWAGGAALVALLLGIAAMAAGRAGRRRGQLTLRRRSGAATARIGRLLGLLGVLLAGTAGIALAVYALLTYRGRT